MQTCAGLTIFGLETRAEWPVWQTRYKHTVIRAWIGIFGDKCLFCGNRMLVKNKKKGVGRSKATIDHINARCFGGTNAPDNLQVICLGCNEKKNRAEIELAVYV